MIKNLRSIASVAGYSHRPVFTFRPEALNRAASFFTSNFRAKLLYAVKTNPDDYVLNALFAQGVTSFDVASLEEIIKLRQTLPDAALYFMHPVKSRQAIREAYFTHNVRHFSLDNEEELYKILEETHNAKDLCLHVRLSIPNTYAELNLSEKFGVSLQEAPHLIRKVAAHSYRTGVCFHVGSQCMHPDAYRIAIRMAGEIVSQSGVIINSFNVGGGFPSIYPGMIPPEMGDFFEAIHDEFDKIPGSKNMTLLAEPGRALVAESMSLVVRVDLRKGNLLYINDGTYGSLFDAGTPKFIYPVRLLRTKEPHSTDLVPFSFYGPTCDSLDFMKGPFYLPKDVREGDHIEIGQMGAYGRTMLTHFNGFRPDDDIVYVHDEPLMTMYGDDITTKPLEVIAA